MMDIDPNQNIDVDNIFNNDDDNNDNNNNINVEQLELTPDFENVKVIDESDNNIELEEDFVNNYYNQFNSELSDINSFEEDYETFEENTVPEYTNKYGQETIDSDSIGTDPDKVPVKEKEVKPGFWNLRKNLHEGGFRNIVRLIGKCTALGFVGGAALAVGAPTAAVALTAAAVTLVVATPFAIAGALVGGSLYGTFKTHGWVKNGGPAKMAQKFKNMGSSLKEQRQILPKAIEEKYNRVKFGEGGNTFAKGVKDNFANLVNIANNPVSNAHLMSKRDAAFVNEMRDKVTIGETSEGTYIVEGLEDIGSHDLARLHEIGEKVNKRIKASKFLGDRNNVDDLKENLSKSDCKNLDNLINGMSKKPLDRSQLKTLESLEKRADKIGDLKDKIATTHISINEYSKFMTKKELVKVEKWVNNHGNKTVEKSLSNLQSLLSDLEKREARCDSAKDILGDLVGLQTSMDEEGIPYTLKNPDDVEVEEAGPFKKDLTKARDYSTNTFTITTQDDEKLNFHIYNPKHFKEMTAIVDKLNKGEIPSESDIEKLNAFQKMYSPRLNKTFENRLKSMELLASMWGDISKARQDKILKLAGKDGVIPLGKNFINNINDLDAYFNLLGDYKSIKNNFNLYQSIDAKFNVESATIGKTRIGGLALPDATGVTATFNLYDMLCTNGLFSKDEQKAISEMLHSEGPRYLDKKERKHLKEANSKLLIWQESKSAINDKNNGKLKNVDILNQYINSQFAKEDVEFLNFVIKDSSGNKIDNSNQIVNDIDEDDLDIEQNNDIW